MVGYCNNGCLSLVSLHGWIGKSMGGAEMTLRSAAWLIYGLFLGLSVGDINYGMPFEGIELFLGCYILLAL